MSLALLKLRSPLAFGLPPPEPAPPLARPLWHVRGLGVTVVAAEDEARPWQRFNDGHRPQATSSISK